MRLAQSLKFFFLLIVVIASNLLFLTACGSNGGSPSISTASPRATTIEAGPTITTGITEKPTQHNTTTVNTPVVTVESPLTPEVNPVGDIPDSQVFISYTSQSNYQLEVPEGWARTVSGTEITFMDKLNGVRVSLGESKQPPTVESVKANQLMELTKTARAVQITDVQTVTLPAGTAVLVSYTSNSEPNNVTGKQVRLENNTYYYYKNDKLVSLTLYAPEGADNVDQWQHIAQSFQWQ